jgi:hypothetical protein
MSRIENALGKISLDSIRRKKAGLAQFEHPLVVIEINKLKKALKTQKDRFFQALHTLGGAASIKQIFMTVNSTDGDDYIPELHLKYMAAYLLENNKIRAEVKNDTVIYAQGSMTDEEYVEFYKELIPVMEKRGVVVKPWVKENINKGGSK